MKNATKLLVATSLIAVSGVLPTPTAQAGPMGPSARTAARLKKYPTSAWLAHYLPDDRYKIAGGVWKFVSTDLDTYYHRPDSPLMLRQPAGRVIGFASEQEAEEAGYRPGPNVGLGTSGFESKSAARSNAKSDQAMRRALAALRELQTISTQTQADRSRNLPLLKQRLQRVIVLLNDIPVTPATAKRSAGLKSAMRGFVKAIDMQMQGDTAGAQRQLGVSLTVLQNSNR